MTVCELIVEHDGYRIVFLLKLVLEVGHLIVWNLEARPAIPLEGGCLGQPAQTTDQAPRGHGHLILALIGALDGDGQAVRYEQQTALARLLSHELCGFVCHFCGVYVWRIRARIEGCAG